MDEKKDEIIIGVDVPKTSKGKKKNNKKKNKKIKKEVAKKATSKDKKNKARILGDTKIFRNRLIKKVILFVLIIVAVIFFFSSSIFNVSEVEISNNELVSDDEIKSLLNVNDTNIFNINKNRVKQRLSSNPYIDDVELKKVLPNKIKLSIKERKIKYMIQLGDAYVYVNNQGYVLDISSSKKDVPILIGITTDVSELNQKGNRLSKEDLSKFDILNKIYETANNNGILPLIDKIDISDTKNYTLHLDSEMKIVYLGNCSDLNTRMLYVNAIIEQEKGIEGEIFVNVDLNEQNVFFREKI